MDDVLYQFEKILNIFLHRIISISALIYKKLKKIRIIYLHFIKDGIILNTK